MPSSATDSIAVAPPPGRLLAAVLRRGFHRVERLGEQCLYREGSRDFEAGVLVRDPRRIRVDPLHEISRESEAYLHRLRHAAFVILAIMVDAKGRRFSVRTPSSPDAFAAVRERREELAWAGTHRLLTADGNQLPAHDRERNRASILRQSLGNVACLASRMYRIGIRCYRCDTTVDDDNDKRR